MVYKTSGVCSSAISFDIDDAGKVHDVKFQGGCSGKTHRGNGCQGSDQQTGRNPLWFQTDFLPGSAFQSIKTGIRRGIKASPFCIAYRGSASDTSADLLCL